MTILYAHKDIIGTLGKGNQIQPKDAQDLAVSLNKEQFWHIRYLPFSF